MGFTIVKVVDTFGAMRNLQVQYSDARSGDVSTVRPWMTTHAISLIYRVPEDYVNSSLDVTSTPVHLHETLYEIASHKRQPVDRVIHTVQRAILTYRKGHRRISMPTRTHRSEEHTSELQSLTNLVCRLLLEKKKTQYKWVRIPVELRGLVVFCYAWLVLQISGRGISELGAEARYVVIAVSLGELWIVISA